MQDSDTLNHRDSNSQSINANKKYNMDLALKEAGGWGKLQSILLVCCALIRNGGMYLVYLFAYLTMEQKYLCRTTADGTYDSCSNEMICELRQNGGFVQYKQDTSYEFYLENWYAQMDMMCMSFSEIGFIFTLYYIGFGIGGVLFPMPDRIGRRKTLLIAGFAHVGF